MFFDLSQLGLASKTFVVIFIVDLTASVSNFISNSIQIFICTKESALERPLSLDCLSPPPHFDEFRDGRSHCEVVL